MAAATPDAPGRRCSWGERTRPLRDVSTAVNRGESHEVPRKLPRQPPTFPNLALDLGHREGYRAAAVTALLPTYDLANVRATQLAATARRGRRIVPAVQVDEWRSKRATRS